LPKSDPVARAEPHPIDWYSVAECAMTAGQIAKIKSVRL